MRRLHATSENCTPRLGEWHMCWNVLSTIRLSIAQRLAFIAPVSYQLNAIASNEMKNSWIIGSFGANW